MLCLTPFFADELKPHRRLVDLDVFVAQGREPERTVQFLVRVVPDPDVRVLYEFYDKRDHLFVRKPFSVQVFLDLLPDGRKCFGKAAQAVKLRLVADLIPIRMVAVLLASALVDARNL